MPSRIVWDARLQVYDGASWWYQPTRQPSEASTPSSLRRAAGATGRHINMQRRSQIGASWVLNPSRAPFSRPKARCGGIPATKSDPCKRSSFENWLRFPRRGADLCDYHEKSSRLIRDGIRYRTTSCDVEDASSSHERDQDIADPL